MTTLQEIESWVRGGESEVVEFKNSTAEKERAFRTICAFANGQGGSLVFGVAPSGKWVGQAVTDRTLEEVGTGVSFFRACGVGANATDSDTGHGESCAGGVGGSCGAWGEGAGVFSWSAV